MRTKSSGVDFVTEVDVASGVAVVSAISAALPGARFVVEEPEVYDLAGAEPARRFSPYCWRIRMALVHKGLSVETIPWRFSDKPAIAHSGQDRVPVIEDGGLVIADSWAIANYLEDTYPDRPSLFGGAAGRAAARFINSWADMVQNRGISTFVALDIVRHLDPRDQEAEHIVEHLDLLVVEPLAVMQKEVGHAPERGDALGRRAAGNGILELGNDGISGQLHLGSLCWPV